MLLILVISLLPMLLDTLHVTNCNIGYGQRGLKFENGVSWERTCARTQYCWEVYSHDIAAMRQLFDYPWNDYYTEFYVTGCGGAFETSLKHPYVVSPDIYDNNGKITVRAVWVDKKVRPFMKINLTTPHIITGHGGTAEFHLKHACIPNLCIPPAGDRKYSKDNQPN